MVIQIETPPMVINQGGSGLVKKGTWDASLNSPSLPIASSENTGDYYVVSASGTTNIDGITDWKVGDILFSNGTVWQKIDQSENVTSVAGKTGDIELTMSDIQGWDIIYALTGIIDIDGTKHNIDFKKTPLIFDFKEE